ncbi:RNA-binding protein [Streptomyces sp. NPDC089922]|uniref:RNA-binding protein n=1 Tax=Streptomyces sp. NPDC089922 TaxID=3155189 RepID=UPI00342592B2
MSEYSWPGENGRHLPDVGSAWSETVRALPISTRVTGEVIGRQPFGVFLSLAGCPDAVGLARIDRMPRCMELPAVGQRVTGEVVWHADHNHQVGIVLGEWAEHGDLSARFPSGETVVGRITKITSSGAFVHLCDCVEGLVPPTGEGPGASTEDLREGRQISVRIVAVDHERHRVLLAEALP